MKLRTSLTYFSTVSSLSDPSLLVWGKVQGKFGIIEKVLVKSVQVFFTLGEREISLGLSYLGLPENLKWVSWLGILGPAPIIQLPRKHQETPLPPQYSVSYGEIARVPLVRLCRF